MPNVRIMETDVDDVSWKDDLVTNQPLIKEGYMTIPSGVGWGTDLNEEVAKEHPWGEASESYWHKISRSP